MYINIFCITIELGLLPLFTQSYLYETITSYGTTNLISLKNFEIMKASNGVISYYTVDFNSSNIIVFDSNWQFSFSRYFYHPANILVINNYLFASTDNAYVLDSNGTQISSYTAMKPYTDKVVLITIPKKLLFQLLVENSFQFLIALENF